MSISSLDPNTAKSVNFMTLLRLKPASMSLPQDNNLVKELIFPAIC